jgi:hypothetical protein
MKLLKIKFKGNGNGKRQKRETSTCANEAFVGDFPQN